MHEVVLSPAQNTHAFVYFILQGLSCCREEGAGTSCVYRDSHFAVDNPWRAAQVYSQDFAHADIYVSSPKRLRRHSVPMRNKSKSPLSPRVPKSQCYLLCEAIALYSLALS